MAQVIDRDLAESEAVEEVVVADRDRVRVEDVLKAVRSEKVRGATIDVTDAPALRVLIRDADAVINATWYELNLAVMKTAIEVGVHYVDLGGLYHMTLKQLALDREAKRAGITCLLGMGSTPGITNVMAAYGAARMDRIDRVEIRTGSTILGGGEETFAVPYSIRTVIDEFSMPAIVYEGGRIQEVAPLSGRERFAFGKPIGAVEGYYTIHSELATLPQTLGKGVRDVNFIVAYPPYFTATMTALVRLGLADKTPLDVKGEKVAPYDFLAAALSRLQPPPSLEDADGLRVDLYGRLDGRKGRLRLDSVVPFHRRWGLSSGAVDTGLPPSVAAQWLASGKIAARGVVPPEVAITDHRAFFRELDAGDRGIRVYEQVNNGPPKPLFR